MISRGKNHLPIRNAKPIKDRKEISKVGSISANNDTTIVDIIAEAMEAILEDASILINEKKRSRTASRSSAPDR